MMAGFYRRFGVAAILSVLIALLYYAEFSRISTTPASDLPGLDNLESSELTRLWEKFYRVRAHIVDGNKAEFDIPDDLRLLEGSRISLKGAADFYSNGCKKEGEMISVSSFLMVPTVGIVNNCEIVPDVEMRWTIMVNLREDWLLTREEMICAEAIVNGRFRIDTTHPYDAAFFLDDATCELAEFEPL